MAIVVNGNSIVGPGGPTAPASLGAIKTEAPGGLVIMGNFPATTLSPLIVTPSSIVLAGASNPTQGSTSQSNIDVYNTYNPSSLSVSVFTRSKFMAFRSSAPAYWGTGLYSTPWELQQIKGSITSTSPGQMQYNTSSDHRLKENVTPVENGLDYIMPLRPRKFTWKNTKQETIGFIAHELDEDFPPHLNNIVSGTKDKVSTYVNMYKDGELLTHGDGGETIVRDIPIDVEAERLTEEGYTWVTVEERPLYQEIDTVGLISPLISSVQQLKKLYDMQQTKIKNLRSRIVELENN